MDRNTDLERQSQGEKQVALHPEGVDRNLYSTYMTPPTVVALHPEGVDRNTGKSAPSLLWLPTVALHPEGVDRNWKGCPCLLLFEVALHPEGVDRNLSDLAYR